ncbi:MAG: SRPBCC family protein [Proteobacteria bacterium]|nr:SRPBCC family protein [Pseudomonadota bacterium]
MKRILLTAAAVLAGAVAVVLVLALRKPDTFVVQRSIAINAPADRIFPLIDDFHRWTQWSPYEAKDPDMKRTFGATTKGRGATYAWDGNGNVGAGDMTITDSAPSSHVAIKLNMVKPISASNDVTFTLVPQGAATQVTWAMRGTAPFISKVMQVVFNMDKMIGGDFEAGLVKLKAAAEK